MLQNEKLIEALREDQNPAVKRTDVPFEINEPVNDLTELQILHAFNYYSYGLYVPEPAWQTMFYYNQHICDAENDNTVINAEVFNMALISVNLMRSSLNNHNLVPHIPIGKSFELTYRKKAFGSLSYYDGAKTIDIHILNTVIHMIPENELDINTYSIGYIPHTHEDNLERIVLQRVTWERYERLILSRKLQNKNSDEPSNVHIDIKRENPRIPFIIQHSF